MPGLVEELQRDALNRSVPVSDSLRKALAIAVKLDLKEFEEWVLLELRGYQDRDISKVPKYRIVRGEARSVYAPDVWLPVRFETAEDVKHFSIAALKHPVSELEGMISHVNEEPVVMSYSPEEIIELRNLTNHSIFGLHVNRETIDSVIQAIRDIILQWSLKLEKEGILGAGMTFSAEEKSTAATTTINIQNMTNSQIQYDTKSSFQFLMPRFDITSVKILIEELKLQVDKIDLEAGRKTQLLTDIQTVEPQLTAPQPKQTIIKECLLSIKTILEGAAANVAAEGILAKLTPILISMGF